MTLEERGSVVVVIEWLARALCFDDRELVTLSITQLGAVFGQPGTVEAALEKAE